MEQDLAAILAEACKVADEAAVKSKAEHGDVGAIGNGYVVIPLKNRKLVKLLEGRTFGGGFKSSGGLYSGYQWTPMVTPGLGQAAHIYFAAAEAATKVLKGSGIEATVRHYYD